MTNPRSGHGRRHVRWIAAAFCLVAVTTIGQAEDGVHSSQKVSVRGQSPYGFGLFTPSLPPEPMTSLRSTSSPWIMASQETPQPYAAAPRVAQAPMDPFGQPAYGSAPLTGDPALGGVFVDQGAIWQPYVAAQGKGGNYSSGAFGQLMMPLYQDGQSLIFADIRGRWDDSSNSEGNFGLALRSMVDPTWFWGIYGFYDYKRTQYGNNFNQGTLGIEAMSVKYEARLNGYIPETKAKQANGASTTEFENGTIFVKGGLERAYYGVDGEIGALLYEEWGGNLEFRGFVGGYWFDTNGNNFPSIAGPKGRLEMRLYDLPCFGPESRLTLGVEVQYDDVRDTQVSGIARLEIPLGFFSPTRRLTRLERRMLDRIVRDDDVITMSAQGPREVGIDSLTKRPLINVQYVNMDTAGGIPGAITKAGVNGTVVVDGSAGAFNTPGLVTPLAGQVLRGGGFQVIGSQTGATANYGTRPTINGTNNANEVIRMTNNFTTVADLDIVGGLHGISSNNANLGGVLVSGNSVTRSVNDAYEFQTLDASSIIQNNVAMSAGRNTAGAIVTAAADGFEFARNGGSISATVRGNSALNSADNGYDFQAITAAGRVTGNLASGNNSDGFRFNGNSGMMAGTVSGNTSTGNGRNAAGTIVTAGADGFEFVQAVSGTVSGNTATNNANDGFRFGSALVAGGKVLDNTAVQNFNHGFFFNTTVDAGSLVSGNYASRNGFNLDGAANPAGIDGFVFNANVAGFVSDNRSENNQQAGYFINGLSGSVLNNTAANNPFGGFVFGAAAVSGTVDKNTAVGSTTAAHGYGFDFTATNLAATARVTENTSSFNRVGYGFNTSTAGAVINGNTASSNGFTTGGTLLDVNGNGFEWLADNKATVTNNFAFSNANNGFSGLADAKIVNFAAATTIFNSNLALQNGDAGFALTNGAGAFFNNNQSNQNAGKGYNVTTNGTEVNNIGSGNGAAPQTVP